MARAVAQLRYATGKITLFSARNKPLYRAIVGSLYFGWEVACWQLPRLAVVVKALAAIAFSWAGAVGAVAMLHIGLDFWAVFIHLRTVHR